MVTRDQIRAQRAYDRVAAPREAKKEADYKRFSKSFPALIHTCGLAQAIAFGQVKDPCKELPDSYMADLAHVAGAADLDELAREARTASLPHYQRLSRDTLAAATWLKRYAEALLKGDDE
jgi:CRISPR-associated protein Cmr5